MTNKNEDEGVEPDAYHDGNELVEACVVEADELYDRTNLEPLYGAETILWVVKMSPETVQRENPTQLFQEDKLFQEQSFNLKTTSSGSTRHIIKSETADGEQKTLCGTTIYLGSPQTLVELAEKGCKERKPSFYTGKICRSCINLFESRTGRTYRQDLNEVEK